MSKELLNEAERYLLEHWEDARLLEEALEGVRTKYKDVFQRIIEAVTQAHPELDVYAAYPTQFWGDGHLGFGQKSWPGGDSNWPSGLWMENLRLERLTSEDAEPPTAFLWVSKKAKVSFDFDAARLVVREAAKDLLTGEELNPHVWDETGEVLLSLSAPTKRQLLRSLSDLDGQAFVDVLVSQFDMMARFVPVLEKLFREHMEKA